MSKHKQQQQHHEKSPFLMPSIPTHKNTKDKDQNEEDVEKKASILGTAGNLINAIIGAGIVGIPFAVKESGLVAGVFLILGVAYLTEKSMRLLVEMAKHMNVPTYEVLCEACFGPIGFYFVSFGMFTIGYGAMIIYLIVVRDTLPRIIGVDNDDEFMKRVVLIISSLLIMFPLSAQRDMADLAKTSTMSVIFDVIMVLVIVVNAPISKSISSEDTDGTISFESLKLFILRNSTIHTSTIFIGLGVLSFAFVCQHSGFIIAGSLSNPTKKRWRIVTSLSLFSCAFLSILCGVSGYLAFQEQTQGNILNNFDSPETESALNAARALLCTTMFLVYPMESFVARHVAIVVFFKGRRAHDGDDHSILARADRRVGLTLILYLCALVPALIFQDLGSVLGVTGAIGGSCLSYIGPGAVYLAVYAETFLEQVEKRWPSTTKTTTSYCCFQYYAHNLIYYITFMPLWCAIARIGNDGVVAYKKEEALKSPHVNRLKVNITDQRALLRKQQNNDLESNNTPQEDKPLLLSSAESSVLNSPRSYNNNNNTDKPSSRMQDDPKRKEEEDDDIPTWSDFVVAIAYIVFGVVAFTAGLMSVYYA